MAGYTAAGTWLTDDGRILYPQYTENLGGVWYALDDKGQSARLGHGFTELPGPPPATTGDTSSQPGGQFTTPDPMNPGYFYRDNPNIVGGAVDRVDAQGNVVGTYQHPNSAAQDEGGRGWNLNQIDPATGGPTSVSYPQESGGLFGLPEGWGALAGVALAVGAGLGVGAGIAGIGALTAPVVAGEVGAGAAAIPASVGTAEAAGLSGEGALFGAAPAAGGAAAAGGGAIGGDLALGTGAAVAGPALGAVAPVASGLGGLTPYAALIASGVPAVTGLIGSGISANAAKSAANTQADAAQKANDTLLAIYNQNRSDLAPYREVGYRALADLVPLTANPLTYGDYTAPAAVQASNYAFDPNAYAFNGAQYAFTPPSGQQVLNDDPGYAFRVSEGMKALERQAAAKGTLISGGQLKAGQQFGQDLASQEYAAAYGRSLEQNQLKYTRGLTENQMNYERGLQGNEMGYERAVTQNQTEAQRALEQYQTNLATQTGLRQLHYNELAGLAGTGQMATQATGQLGAQTGAQVANNITSAGAAQAAGTVGAANALNQGIQSVGGAANNYLNYQLLSSLLQSRRAA